MREVKQKVPMRTWGDWFDDVVFAVAPSWGLSRRNARRRDRIIRDSSHRIRHHFSRAWESADNDRFRGAKWLVSQISANSQLEQDMETLRVRSEDLYRNDCYGASATAWEKRCRT